VDAHGSLAPSLASKHPFLSRTHALQGFTCPHNSETAFERRFQALLRSAWQKRSWHVMVADPGSGKTMGIRDVIRTNGSPSGTLPGRSYPILALTAPKNDESQLAHGNHTVRESIPFQKELLLSDQPLKLNDQSIEKKRSICVTLL